MTRSVETHNPANVPDTHEEAIQSLCKQLLKSRLFRGHYIERRRVESLSAFRDVVKLERSERDLEKLLLYVKQKLHLFYQHKPNLWVGITSDAPNERPLQTNLLDTCLWIELEDHAFGQYWFLIKSVRFRDNEIVLKLKAMRSIDEETNQRPHQHVTSAAPKRFLGGQVATELAGPSQIDTKESTVAFDDFVQLVQNWGNDFKHTVYDFMSNDINKQNIKSVLQFLGLLVISLLSGSVMAIKYLGIFTLRFMFEFSRFTHVITPIILKIIEVINKIIGGFYILLTMIWKDAVVNRGQGKAPPTTLHRLPYNRAPLQSIEHINPPRMHHHDDY